jgi:hypothetical protein
VTISLPSSWGPATVLTVGLILIAAIGGLVQVIMGDLSYQAWIDSLQAFAIAAGVLAVGRGIGVGGPGTGFGSSGPDGGVGK